MMRRHVPLNVERWWECPSCGHQARTTRGGIITPMHRCARQAGLEVPLVQVDSNAGLGGRVRHVAIEREDMIGRERGILLDANGKAIMAIRTERRDGSYDTNVFPGTATGTGQGESR